MKDYFQIKAVDEMLIKEKLAIMWNKLQNLSEDLLLPIIDTLERTRINNKVRNKIEELKNQNRGIIKAESSIELGNGKTIY